VSLLLNCLNFSVTEDIYEIVNQEVLSGEFMSSDWHFHFLSHKVLDSFVDDDENEIKRIIE